MMYNLWTFTRPDGIIHYPSYMKNVVGTWRAAFLRPPTRVICVESVSL